MSGIGRVGVAFRLARVGVLSHAYSGVHSVFPGCNQGDSPINLPLVSSQSYNYQLLVPYGIFNGEIAVVSSLHASEKRKKALFLGLTVRNVTKTDIF